MISTLSLGIAAGLVHLAGYLSYDRIMTRKGRKPNAASWFMWAAGGLTELSIFAGLVEVENEEATAELSKEILPALCAVVAIYIFARIWWRKKRFPELENWDKGMVVFDFSVVALWFIFKNPYVSNLLLALDLIASFIPTIKGVRKNPRYEHPLPWAIWTVGYLILAVVVVQAWETPWELLYPLLCAALHGTVWYYSKAR